MNNLRKILTPFSWVYCGVTSLRNSAYDNGVFKSKKYDIPVICIGNLSTGGTGKSPMTAFLVSFLKDHYKVAVLSRGYGRKTSGFIEVTKDSTARQVGDEPLQLKQNHPAITVAVCEDRQTGIETLQESAEVIVLDDAFQHRKVVPSFSILLTSFNDLYCNDTVLPAGNLRESQKGAARADVIVVTKCPNKVAYAKLQEIEYKLKLKPNQKIYFSRIVYDRFIYGVTERLELNYLKDKPFTLVTGIANPEPLVEFLNEKGFNFKHKKYGDHHNFSTREIDSLKKDELILTTEKDYMRLQHGLQKFALYYLPITVELLKDQISFFKKTILDSVKESYL